MQPAIAAVVLASITAFFFSPVIIKAKHFNDCVAYYQSQHDFTPELYGMARPDINLPKGHVQALSYKKCNGTEAD